MTGCLSSSLTGNEGGNNERQYHHFEQAHEKFTGEGQQSDGFEGGGGGAAEEAQDPAGQDTADRQRQQEVASDPFGHL